MCLHVTCHVIANMISSGGEWGAAINAMVFHF